MNRRGFLIGLGSGLVAAPSIVRASSLMQIKGVPLSVSRLLYPGVDSNWIEIALGYTITYQDDHGSLISAKVRDIMSVPGACSLAVNQAR